MDLLSIQYIKELLGKHYARPSKGLGQNFLIDASVLAEIIKAADLGASDFVIEIGPGIGTLTQALAREAGKVAAIEKDNTMAEILKETMKEYPSVEVISGDILKFSIINFQLSKYKVVANIPYYLTSPLIRKFLESGQKPEAMVLMVQKEVAERICAAPPRMSLLAVSVQFYAKAKIISYVKKECFWPRPKVDSAIIQITPFSNPPSISPEAFFKVVKAGFLQPRKQLVNNLFKGLKKEKGKINQVLLAHGINPSQRAETLSVEDWTRVATSFKL